MYSRKQNIGKKEISYEKEMNIHIIYVFFYNLQHESKERFGEY